ncbi:hypothetical protein [Tabrizicola sp. YIM 78059]|uniref:hypothetical protein n=1 Tax=Tabrizicola sp. YIM 78059 TaxID=2529861 RepID=UPI0010AB079C|nr:hypothetical protein [Tabrizicola sp. YIM 78059]
MIPLCSCLSALLLASIATAQVIPTGTPAAAPETLALPPDTPYSEVARYCQAQTQWFMRWNRRDFIQLATALPEAFE